MPRPSALACLIACAAAFAPAAGRAQSAGPWMAPQQASDPYAQERLKECQDLGSYAVVDAPGGNSGQINVSSGSKCADLPSLQPNWMPYLQLNVNAPVADTGGGTDTGGGGSRGWSNNGWNPHGGVRVR